MSELKPCPFCGTPVVRTFDGTYWAIGCDECPNANDGVITHADVFGRDEGKVIAAWNRRSDPNA